jgi:hypothetical protein
VYRQRNRPSSAYHGMFDHMRGAVWTILDSLLSKSPAALAITGAGACVFLGELHKGYDVRDLVMYIGVRVLIWYDGRRSCFCL